VLTLLLAAAVKAELAAHYALDDLTSPTTADSAGSLDGDNKGAEVGVSGVVGTAFQFDGVDDYVWLPRIIGGNSQLTISLWARSDVAEGAHTAFSLEDVTAIRICPGSPAPSCQSGASYFDAFIDVGGTRRQIRGLVADTEWHLHTVVYSGTAVTYYIDGLAQGFLPASGLVDSTSDWEQRIGAWTSGTSGIHWDGTIDDVRIYDHALTAAEVEVMYQDPEFEPPSPAAPPAACETEVPAPQGRSGLVVVIHGWGPDFLFGWIDEMSDSILERVDTGEWAVHSCHWDSAWFRPELARSLAKQVGRRLGAEIESAGYTQVHLLAHSAGSWAAEWAARQVPATTLVHITFMDAYAPWGVGTQHDGLGSAADHAEHFVDTNPIWGPLPGTGLGDPLSPLFDPYFFLDQPTNAVLAAAHNIDVTGVHPSFIGHSWPHEFYQLSLDDPDGSLLGWGFRRSAESTEEPIDHNAFPRGEVTPLGVGPVLQLLPAYVLRYLDPVDWANQVAKGKVTMIGDTTLDGSHLTITTLLGDGGGAGGAPPTSPDANPGWVLVDLQTPVRAEVLQVEYEFTAGSGGSLSVGFDGDQLAVLRQDDSPLGRNEETIALLGAYPPGSYPVSIRLDSGPAGATVEVSSLRLGSTKAFDTPGVQRGGLLALVAGVMLSGVLFLRMRTPSNASQA